MVLFLGLLSSSGEEIVRRVLAPLLLLEPPSDERASDSLTRRRRTRENEHMWRLFFLGICPSGICKVRPYPLPCARERVTMDI